MPGNASRASIFTPRDQVTNISFELSPGAATSQTQLRLPPAKRLPNPALETKSPHTPSETDASRPWPLKGYNDYRSEDADETARFDIRPQTAPTSHPRPFEQEAPTRRDPSSSPISTRKRLSDISESSAAQEHRPKRPRLKPRLKYELNSTTLSPSSLQTTVTPPSPLFFSNSPRPRPKLPPRFSSSEAAARMLSKARGEDSHIKTVSLARGTVTTPAIPTNAPSPNAARRSIERSSTGRSHSPESSSGREGTGSNIYSHLNSIGITELLEQDERPTFVIDLSDSSNYGAGSLHPVFTNLSLRSFDSLPDYIIGTTPGEQSSDASTFIQFKSWLLSATVNGESLNVCLPAFTYAGITWNCSTLRKRLRILSGTFAQSPRAKPTPTVNLGPVDTTQPPSVPSVQYAEPTDYFGAAAMLPSESAAENNSTELTTINVRTSIERSNVKPAGSTSSDGKPGRLSAGNTSPGYPSSNYAPHILTSPNGALNIGSDSYSLADTQLSDLPSFDWTQIPITDAMPQHIRFARSVDWTSTALGPIERWAPDLRQMCNLIMASPHPAAMYWGPDLIAIYNEAYVLLAGQKHPTLMGQSYREAWSEIWSEVKDVFASAQTTGEATMKDDDCLFMKRNNYLEETYFSWAIIPMLGDDGSVMGLYNPAFEKTRRKIAERRMLTLREVGERTASARDISGFWAQILDSFEFNEYDSPFLLLYSVADENDSDASSVYSNSAATNRQCTLEGALGVPAGHPAAPAQIDLKSGMEGFGPVFREVMKTDKPTVIDIGSRDLPSSLLEGLDWRGFGDASRSVVICPIHPTTGESVLGFLVLGVNPRRPYDDDYSLFVQLLSRQLATSLASVVLFEEEIRRGQRAARLAALDRIELSEQLAARTQEAIDSETKFARMAEFAPVGMFIAGSDGRITFANDTWYEISRVPKSTSMADTWIEAVKPDDRPLVEKMWRDLVVGLTPVSNEFRFKAQCEDRNGLRGDTWVLFSAYPEKHDGGKLKSIFGSITNISQQKWAEGIQTRKMEEAFEMKRQQENFIDITSHEMRNPLSAILQCADEIANSLGRVKQDGISDEVQDVISSCLDAAQTITLCSQHQKRIVDDVLTLSKLDSKLLLVTPVDAQPLTVVQRALKMHEGELQAADIQMRFVVDQSFKDLNLDWLRFDPSRVLQVLINLTTNAIKFTTTEKKRTITVSIGASMQRPSDVAESLVQYFPTRSQRRDSLQEGDWGEGEKVFVQFAVQDTGRGLSPEEKKLLFLRFSQTSPRTHVQYGGSGLGLFISRELTELQGGEIGVASESGKGSTFAFYIIARRSAAPAEGDPSKVLMQRFSGDGKTKPNSANGVDGKAVAVSKSTPAAVRKVLIVEDNLVNQRVLQKQLKNLGTEVHLANHGGEALDKLRQSTYWAGAGPGKKLELGVVLMDQEMPVMDGLTCTRKIRELEKEGKLTCHVPIIAVTANARQEQIQTALEAGMDDVVSKPFRIPDLLPKIEELQQRYPMPLTSDR